MEEDWISGIKFSFRNYVSISVDAGILTDAGKIETCF